MRLSTFLEILRFARFLLKSSKKGSNYAVPTRGFDLPCLESQKELFPTTAMYERCVKGDAMM